MSVLTKYTIFAGNGGAGKSTLLNGQAGKVKFQSGISICMEGLTTVLQLEPVGDMIYGDTPGLDDPDKRKQAAKAITEAFKQNGQFKLCFVCLLDSGRLRTADVTTMSLILASLPNEVEFGIIFNMVSKSVLEKSKINNNDGKRIFEANINEMIKQSVNRPCATGRFFYSVKQEHLEDRDDTLPSEESVAELKNWLEKLPMTTVRSNNVKDIPYKTYEQINTELEKKVFASSYT
eukprot:Awhi_evm1s13990